MTNKTPPREFWISLGQDCDDIVWRYRPKNEHYNFHVIEKSHADTLQAKLDLAQAKLILERKSYEDHFEKWNKQATDNAWNIANAIGERDKLKAELDSTIKKLEQVKALLELALQDGILEFEKYFSNNSHT